ncbi:MAG: cytochrome B [Gammaproteobacteria bacterium HGW-Gammaproteobacteria-3]|nr:MAG: cytochrome B [Gammaproteobacteria bacterium HGW-Gammaproteobacteria-3]
MKNVTKVWDLPIRLFHWLLVIGFFVAYFTEEDFLTPHVWAGYLVFGLLVFRLLWGFIGNRYARFSSFLCSPVQSIAYLKNLIHGKPERYLGHNPAGAAMIVLLLLSLLITTVTGFAVYALEEQSGPLVGVITQNEDFWEETHEFFANFTVFLVILHVGGVIAESRRHKENLIKAMFSGYKRADDETHNP